MVAEFDLRANPKEGLAIDLGEHSACFGKMKVFLSHAQWEESSPSEFGILRSPSDGLHPLGMPERREVAEEPSIQPIAPAARAGLVDHRGGYRLHPVLRIGRNPFDPCARRGTRMSNSWDLRV